MAIDTLPPPGFPFRFFSVNTNEFLSTKDGLTLSKSMIESVDQLFVLVEDPTSEKGDAFVIQSLQTGEVLHMGDNSKLSLADKQSGHSSQRFTFEPRTVNSVAGFSLFGFAPNSATASRPDIEVTDDKIWSAVVSLFGAEVVDVVFDTKGGRLSQTAPQFLASETVTNDSSVTQSSEVNLEKSVAITHSFTATTGVALTVGATFEAGIPLVAEGQIKTEATAKQEFTWGHTTTTNTTVGHVVKVTAPPHSKVKATGAIKCSVVDIPCTMHLRARVPKEICLPGYTIHLNFNADYATHKTKMMYHGLTYWDFNVHYE